MMNSLIGPDQSLALLTVMLGLVWIGAFADRHPVLSKVPGIVWILVGATFLSNLGVIPLEAPVYGVIFTYILPLAVPMLLMKAQFSKVIAESGRVLLIFLIGSLTVCAGGLLAGVIFDLGPLEAKILATYVAAWIGGMVNMLSLSQLTELSPSEFSIALSASAPVSILGLVILCTLPSIPFVRRHIPSAIIDRAEAGPDPVCSPADQEQGIGITHLSAAFAISAVIGTASHALVESDLFPSDWNIQTYNLFIITIITIIIANIFPTQLARIRGEFDLGMILMYLFFAAIGAGTDAVTFIDKAPIYFLFALTIIASHIILILLAARIFRFDLAETIIGSGANIVGAAPAAGIASSRGWNHLVTPAIATGMLGYAIANFFGLALYTLLG